ncbi:LLM class flavin-dependent oxidoreductase [Streptomyces sanglieri]|uniref:LLM class flavin-dependent oxidoreductase n=1 Tax=Streptomyces sanglieri TaxID=193460 RepID=A0ABW2X3R6_9ACTN
MDLSVMFFGADSTTAGEARHTETYEDILAVARTADRLGFHAVWTPERHFQQVGQVFPSPPVLSAALAVATERIGIRAGSVVLPLHHPLRVAEDWAVVDNLSHGRVGLSVATGWHSKDFTLAPEQYADRRRTALETIPRLRSLWAGEPAEYPDGTGDPVSVTPSPGPCRTPCRCGSPRPATRRPGRRPAGCAPECSARPSGRAGTSWPRRSPATAPPAPRPPTSGAPTPTAGSR